ncbi:hypothetical protein G7Z17_g9682 [Cylindrodendrum hubeiense]|uniref:Uncharacterized protein n=1 Tax=Cylindrodendrum hubeiense TaxID=595255 RepID=A0A9P5LBY8_9HYPO|nr:hypothetical protein G7Z17_g9682 [Cylindrodendrum hubeiense]
MLSAVRSSSTQAPDPANHKAPTRTSHLIEHTHQPHHTCPVPSQIKLAPHPWALLRHIPRPKLVLFDHLSLAAASLRLHPRSSLPVPRVLTDTPTASPHLRLSASPPLCVAAAASCCPSRPPPTHLNPPTTASDASRPTSTITTTTTNTTLPPPPRSPPVACSRRWNLKYRQTTTISTTTTTASDDTARLLQEQACLTVALLPTISFHLAHASSVAHPQQPAVVHPPPWPPAITYDFPFAFPLRPL